MESLDQLLTEIANTHLNIRTLATRMSDSLDFHDVAVWAVKDALATAFNAGIKAGCFEQQSALIPCLASTTKDSQTPLLVSKGQPLLPGKMYLRLYHGRTNAEQEMEDWGFAGPTFGPLSCYVHTYCSTFRIHGDYDRELSLKTHEDMIQWEGCFYGDMEVFIAGTGEKA